MLDSAPRLVSPLQGFDGVCARPGALPRAGMSPHRWCSRHGCVGQCQRGRLAPRPCDRLLWRSGCSKFRVVKAPVKTRKRQKAESELAFDPVLFAASVPSRKPTPKDLRDTAAHENDPIEPREYDDPGEMLDAP